MAPKKKKKRTMPLAEKNEIPSWDWFWAFFFFLVRGQCLFFIGGRQYPHAVSQQRSCDTSPDHQGNKNARNEILESYT